MIRALALNCTLTPSPGTSSTELLAGQVLAAMAEHGVEGEQLRVVDFDVKPGVEADMGDGDAWPGIRSKILAADILLVCSPTWMGHMSSVASRVLERLAARDLVARMRIELGDFEYKACVDTAPILERTYARLAGLGWIGKNTCVINQQQGSYLFLGEILVSLDLEPDTAAPYRCGTCTRCIDACPTAAIVPGGIGTLVDSRRCISYLTIELRGPIPEDLRSQTGAHVFGCDICQEVCPWNSKAAFAADAITNDAPADLELFANMSPEEFRAAFRHTPVWRTRYSGFLRNVAVAMGNSSDPRYRPMLETLAGSPDAVVAEHAQWALSRLPQPA